MGDLGTLALTSAAPSPKWRPRPRLTVRARGERGPQRALEPAEPPRWHLSSARAVELVSDQARWTLAATEKPPWASAMGRDRYGLFAEFSLQGKNGEPVVQRLRWIAPGRFWMGSPESEPERYGNETRHRVTLTEGYWLADTACTQALWQAVTGENPSQFKGVARPVEQVSWHDCDAFLKELNRQVPGLEARLPTEAQWEYACRAGTEGPFSFGDTITPEQVNYDGNHPYAGGKKGLYRRETVEVGSLPANAWGLYEMHGNVDEWCRDWFGDYGGAAAVNPTGPTEGGLRVVRGGSWVDDAGFARSAFRDGLHPGLRLGGLGLRLSRGP